MCWTRNAGSVLAGLLHFVLCKKLQEPEIISQTCLGFLGTVSSLIVSAWREQKQESVFQLPYRSLYTTGEMTALRLHPSE